MNKEDLIKQIKEKKSFLCVGLDTDINKIPKHLLTLSDPIFEFNKQIIDSTKDLCVAYKLNTAFYESNGIEGWKSLIKTAEYIPKNIFSIADAKRGDIGNTSRMYAKTFFETMDFDSLTVNPYMGIDSVEPFLEFDNKWVILLALTSNKGSEDFQNICDLNDIRLYQHVLQKSSNWADDSKMMYVVGATKPGHIEKIRSLIPNHFLLMPGVGAQGGDLNEICKYALNDNIGIIVNSSRSIIYASDDETYASAAADQAMILQNKMKLILSERK